MFYPFKFKPIYKDYIWGGRNLEQLGRKLPAGIVAESWELSCHPNGLSIVSNGEYSGRSLAELLQGFGRQIAGTAIPDKDIHRFPLLLKLIDANDKLSVQVHPDDNYAFFHENGELGKNEMWYILAAKPGAGIISGVLPGTTPEVFGRAVREGQIEHCLKYVPVSSGDTINIPAGLVHAIGEGIVLAEIQQNSDTTYRVYDYDRIDQNGNRRQLQIKKALEVIDFTSADRPDKIAGLTVRINAHSSINYLVANKYFAVELYDIEGSLCQNADGCKFYIYLLTEGAAEIRYDNSAISLTRGETVLIPALLGDYALTGHFKALKTYVPNLEADIIAPLKKIGYSETEIFSSVGGLKDG